MVHVLKVSNLCTARDKGHVSPYSYKKKAQNLEKKQKGNYVFFQSHTRLAVLKQGQFCPPGVIWQYMETVLIVMFGRGGATGVQWVEAGMLQNIYTGQPLTTVIQP